MTDAKKLAAGQTAHDRAHYAGATKRVIGKALIFAENGPPGPETFMEALAIIDAAVKALYEEIGNLQEAENKIVKMMLKKEAK
jgi:hypothetical protein